MTDTAMADERGRELMASKEEIEEAGKAAYATYMQFLTNARILPGFADKRDFLKLHSLSEKFWQQVGAASLEAAGRVRERGVVQLLKAPPMTDATARDVIAKELVDRGIYGGGAFADAILSALLAAPESVRLEELDECLCRSHGVPPRPHRRMRHERVVRFVVRLTRDHLGGIVANNNILPF